MSNLKIDIPPSLSLSLPLSLPLSLLDLDSEAKMSRMYEFMFTHMRGLESRLSEVVRTTSKRFSQVEPRIQALEQRAVEETVHPYESTAEIVVSGLTTRSQLSYEDIVTRIFNFIGATRFLVDVISIRKLNSAKENESSSTPNGDTAVLTPFSLILRFKSVQVRKEIKEAQDSQREHPYRYHLP